MGREFREPDEDGNYTCYGCKYPYPPEVFGYSQRNLNKGYETYYLNSYCPECWKIVRANDNAKNFYHVPGKIKFKEWREMIELFEGKCAYCEDPADYLSPDHIDALSTYAKGNLAATNTIDNIVPVCKICQAAKRERSVVEHLEYIDKIRRQGAI